MMGRLAAILAGIALLPAAASAQVIGIGTSPQGTLTYTLAATYAKVFEETTKVQARVQPSSGTTVMVPLVNSGELDIGFANALESTTAYHGTLDFDKNPQKNLRLVAVLFPIQSSFFVRKDAPLKTIKDIKGHSVAYGYTSQSIIKTVVDAIMANAGYAAADMKTVLVPNLIRGVDEFVSGKVELGQFAVGGAKVAEADAAVGGIRFLPMDDSPEAVARMKQVMPVAYIDTLDPAPNRVGVAAPTKLMFYDYTMFVNASVPQERVYQMTKVIMEQQAALIPGFALFKGMDVKRAYRDIGMPYHEGALAYFKDHGIALTK